MEDDSDSEKESEQELEATSLDDNGMLVSKFVTEVEDVNAKEANNDVEDEVTLELWEQLISIMASFPVAARTRRKAAARRADRSDILFFIYTAYLATFIVRGAL